MLDTTTEHRIISTRNKLFHRLLPHFRCAQKTFHGGEKSPKARLFRHFHGDGRLGAPPFSQRHREKGGKPRIQVRSHRPHVVLPRQAAHPARDFQFKKRRKNLRRRQLRLHHLQNFVDLQALVGAQNLQYDGLLWPQNLLRQERCGGLGFGCSRRFRLKFQLHVRG